MTRKKAAAGANEIAPPSAVSENGSCALDSQAQRPAILVADGQAARRRPVEEMLRQAGYTVRSAASIPGVLRQLGSRPDLILLSGRLPGTDPRNALGHIRSVAAVIPVIVFLPPKERNQGPLLLAAGAEACLVRPCRQDILLPLVQCCLEKGQGTLFLPGYSLEKDHRSQEEIRRREVYFHQLIQNSMDIIAATDAEGIIRYHSPSVERILGFSPGERIGQTTFELLHPEDHDRALARFQECLARPGERITDEDIRLRDKAGNWHHFEVTARNLLEDPAVAGIIVNAKDVTAYRRMEQTLQERGRTLAERVKELDCLYRISRLMQRPAIALEEILQDTVQIITQSWQEPARTCCRIVLFDQTYESPGFLTSPWRQTADIIVNGECRGMVEIFYHRPAGDGPDRSGSSPLLEEEEKLLTAVAERLGRVAERIIAQDERRHDLLRVESLRALNKLVGAPVSRIADFTLEAIVRDTNCGFGFIGFLNPDETAMTIYAWSQAAMEQCQVRGQLLHFPIAQAGLWGEAVRQRRPCFMDDYNLDHPAKRGTPDGHAPIVNFMGVPVFEGETIMAVAGLANRQGGFREIDAKHVSVLLEDMWQLLQRKEAEDALRESEAHYRTLFERTVSPIFLINRRGGYVDANQAGLDFLEISRNELAKKNVQDFLVPGKEAVMEEHRPLWDTGGIIETEYFVNGRVKVLDLSITPSVRRGQPVLFGIGNDITERRRFQERQQELTAMIEQSADAMIRTDTDFRITYVNAAAERLFGWSLDELRGHTPDMLNAEPKSGDVQVEMYAQVSAGQTYFGEVVNRRKEGSLIYCQVKFSPLLNKDGEIYGYLGCQRDITRQKRAEAELEKAHKLESIGLLAGGIAHDFNNILTILWGNIQMARMNQEPGDPKGNYLAEAEKSCQRARDLVKQLSTFAKGDAPVKETTPLLDLIPEITRFVLRGSNVKPEFSIPEDLPAADADRSQISQVIENIVINADQAMPDGGRLKIAAETVAYPANGGDPELMLAPGQYLRVSITDQGPGIPAEDQLRVFDPYWTTKPKGTGLGLATCYSIMKKHNGHVALVSAPGRGTTFFLYLPVARQQVVRKARSQTVDTGQRGRILIMDDDAGVREVTGEMLRHLGYTVDDAAGGEEAVTMYRQALASGTSYDAVILDLTVPGGMGGVDTINALRDLDAGVKALVSSGYSEESVIAQYESYGFQGVVPKPVDLKTLSRELKRVLG